MILYFLFDWLFKTSSGLREKREIIFLPIFIYTIMKNERRLKTSNYPTKKPCSFQNRVFNFYYFNFI